MNPLEITKQTNFTSKIDQKTLATNEPHAVTTLIQKERETLLPQEHTVSTPKLPTATLLESPIANLDSIKEKIDYHINLFLNDDTKSIEEIISHFRQSKSAVLCVDMALRLLRSTLSKKTTISKRSTSLILGLIEPKNDQIDDASVAKAFKCIDLKTLLELAELIVKHPDLEFHHQAEPLPCQHLIAKELLSRGQKLASEHYAVFEGLIYPEKKTLETVSEALATLKSDRVTSINTPSDFQAFVSELQTKLEDNSTVPSLDPFHLKGIKLAMEAISHGGTLLWGALVSCKNPNQNYAILGNFSPLKILDMMSEVYLYERYLSDIEAQQTDLPKGDFAALSIQVLFAGNVKNTKRIKGIYSHSGGYLLSKLLERLAPYLPNDKAVKVHQEIHEGLAFARFCSALNLAQGLAPSTHKDKEQLLTKMVSHIASDLLEKTAIKPTPFRLGYSHSPSGHDVWSIFSKVPFKRTGTRYIQQTINSGFGFSCHNPAQRSPLGHSIRPATVTSPLLTKKRTTKILEQLMPYQRNGELSTLARAGKCGSLDPSSFAIKNHYRYNGLMSYSDTEFKQENSSAPLKKRQRGGKCVSKSLFRTVEMLLNDSDLYTDVRFLIKGTLHWMSQPHLKDWKFEKEASEACRQHLYKVVLRQMEVRNVPFHNRLNIVSTLIESKRPPSDSLIEDTIDRTLQQGNLEQIRQLLLRVMKMDFSKGLFAFNHVLNHFTSPTIQTLMMSTLFLKLNQLEASSENYKSLFTSIPKKSTYDDSWLLWASTYNWAEWIRTHSPNDILKTKLAFRFLPGKEKIMRGINSASENLNTLNLPISEFDKKRKSPPHTEEPQPKHRKFM